MNEVILKSETIAALACALSTAQGLMQSAKKDADNPFFKSKYADLASVWDACRIPLTSNGLAVIQLPGKNGDGYFVDTMLTHKSGEFIVSRLSMKPVKDDPQGLGSAITYARRYALQAMVGIAPEEDDGEESMGRDAKPKPEAKKEPEPKRELTEDEKYNATVLALRARIKKHCGEHNAFDIEAALCNEMAVFCADNKARNILEQFTRMELRDVVDPKFKLVMAKVLEEAKPTNATAPTA